MGDPVQGDIQINTANIDDDDVMTPEQADRAAEEQRQIQAENEEKVRKQEENAKKRKQIQDEQKRQREENAKKKQEEQEKQEQEKQEEKRKQAEEEQKKKEDEAKKIRRYDEYLDVKKTIFLQMPTFSLFTLLSKQKYKLLYIPYTYIVETGELKQENKQGGANTNKSEPNENADELAETTEYDEPVEVTEDDDPLEGIEEVDQYESDSSSSWFGSNRNDKLIEINVDKNQITNYNIGATYDKQMKEYKNFDVEMLYVRLIFSINKSKEISLYNIFLYYIINVRGKTLTRPDEYKLDNFTLYDDELEILNKKNSKLDIADLLTEETKETNKNVYYVYIYDIIKNKMVAEFNIANLDNIHNVSNENTTYGGIKESKPNNSRTKLQNKTHNHKNAKTIRTYRNANRGKTLRNLRK